VLDNDLLHAIGGLAHVDIPSFLYRISWLP